MIPANSHVPSKYELYLQSEDFDDLRQKVLDRDGHKCVVCGSTEALHIHHLTYRNVYHEELRDLITLCGCCHHIFHTVDKYRELAEEHYKSIDWQEEAKRRESERAQYEKRNRELKKICKKIEEEIKAEYTDQDYAQNGDLDMCQYPLLNSIIKEKMEKYGVSENEADYVRRKELQDYFLYKRYQVLLLVLIKKNYTLDDVLKRSKFKYKWLADCYREDKLRAKIKEYELIHKKEDK